MTSIFDSIKISGTSSYGNGGSSSASSGVAAGTTGTTGLIASVTNSEFEKLVSDSVDAVVLKASLNSGRAVPGKKSPPQLGHRYVFPCAGIVFVTTSSGSLTFGPGVREVNCLAIAHLGQALAPETRTG